MQPSRHDRRQLARVAEAIADGTLIDWQDRDLSRGRLGGQLDRLRVIQTITAVHRVTHVSATARAGVPADGAPGADNIIAIRRPSSEPDTPGGHAVASRPFPRRWGSLEIRERIGCGGYGEVFRAHDPALKLDVALKLLYPWNSVAPHEDVDESFLEEGRSLASVRHENVLTVHGADRRDGRVGIWTDLVQGQTLEQGLAQRGAFSAREASLICMDVCKALAAVHGAGLIHGDVKASNVMREAGTGKIILMDFSSVRERRGAARDTWSICGTPIYMAPELLNGNDAGEQSDIYSLGVLVYRLVTQRFPVEAGSLRELRDRIARGEIRPLREVRPDLDTSFIQVVERALAVDPADRHPSVADMERDLARTLGSSRPTPSAPVQRWHLALAIGLMAVVGFLATPTTPLEVQATLYRASDAGTQVLTPGAPIALNDKLFLEVDGNRSMYLYVLNLSDRGDVVLYPLPEMNHENPVARGNHSLPGPCDNGARCWDVGYGSGPETIFAVASVSPLPQLEELMARMPFANSRRTAERRAGIVRRSIDGLDHGPARGEVDRLIATLLGDGGSERRDIWTWKVQLTNNGPGPTER